MVLSPVFFSSSTSNYNPTAEGTSQQASSVCVCVCVCVFVWDKLFPCCRVKRAARCAAQRMITLLRVCVCACVYVHFVSVCARKDAKEPQNM